MDSLALSVNEDIKSRVTYSALLRRINPDDMQAFILAQMDVCGLGHNTFTEGALDLVVRSGEGVLRKVRNLCLSCLLEGLRAQTRTIDIDIVNRVLIQPHWRKDNDLPQYCPAVPGASSHIKWICRPEDRATLGSDLSAVAVFRSRRGRVTAPPPFVSWTHPADRIDPFAYDALGRKPPNTSITAECRY